MKPTMSAQQSQFICAVSIEASKAYIHNLDHAALMSRRKVRSSQQLQLDMPSAAQLLTKAIRSIKYCIQTTGVSNVYRYNHFYFRFHQNNNISMYSESCRQLLEFLSLLNWKKIFLSTYVMTVMYFRLMVTYCFTVFWYHVIDNCQLCVLHNKKGGNFNVHLTNPHLVHQ